MEKPKVPQDRVYQLGRVSQFCSSCDWKEDNLKVEKELCPVCGAILDGDCSITFGGTVIRFKKRKGSFTICNQIALEQKVVIYGADFTDTIVFMLKHNPCWIDRNYEEIVTHFIQKGIKEKRYSEEKPYSELERMANEEILSTSDTDEQFVIDEEIRGKAKEYLKENTKNKQLYGNRIEEPKSLNEFLEKLPPGTKIRVISSMQEDIIEETAPSKPEEIPSKKNAIIPNNASETGIPGGTTLGNISRKSEAEDKPNPTGPVHEFGAAIGNSTKLSSRKKVIESADKMRNDMEPIKKRVWFSCYFKQRAFTFITAPFFIFVCICIIISIFGAVVQGITLIRVTGAVFGLIGIILAVALGWLPIILPPLLYIYLLVILSDQWQTPEKPLKTKILATVAIIILCPLAAYLIFHGDAWCIGWIADQNPCAAFEVGVTGSKQPVNCP